MQGFAHANADPNVEIDDDVRFEPNTAIFLPQPHLFRSEVRADVGFGFAETPSSRGIRGTETPSVGLSLDRSVVWCSKWSWWSVAWDEPLGYILILAIINQCAVSVGVDNQFAEAIAFEQQLESAVLGRLC